MSLDSLFSNAVSTYKNVVNSAIDNLGKISVIYFEDTVASTINDTFYDTLRDDDSLKPQYKETQSAPAPSIIKNIKLFRGIIQWNTRDYESWGIRIDNPKGIVRIKSFITDMADLQRCKYIVPDVNVTALNGTYMYIPLKQPQDNISDVSLWFDSSSVRNCNIRTNLNAKFRLIRDVQPRGMGDSDYIYTYWEQTS